ncbi:unnamed protein product, partial [marine sediment metagenome]
HANIAEGWVLAEGAVKYEARNWEKGIPIGECLASTMRHLEDFKLGLRDEPHLAQARTNIGFILHYLGEIEAGRMDPAIDDMPKYVGRPTTVRNLIAEAVEEVMNPPQTGLDADEREVADSAVVHYVPHKRPTVYIAGPMRGYPLYNFPAFDEARDRWKTAYNVISPADLDREAGFDPAVDPEGFSGTHAGLVRVMYRDLDAILNLDPERGDCLAVLPGWQDSKGARVEVALARFLGLSVYDAHGTPVED